MADFITILSNFGFPVALSAYLLFRFERKLEKLDESITEMKEVVGGCPGRRKR